MNIRTTQIVWIVDYVLYCYLAITLFEIKEVLFTVSYF